MKLFKKDYSIDASLSVDERVAYGAGNFATGFANTGMGVFVLFYFTNYVGLNAGIVGTILLVSRFLDGISDLLMGYIVDRTHSKNGKARPWILRACVPLAVATVLLFAVPGNHVSVAQYIWVFVTYNLLNTVLYTMCAVSYSSLTCLLTQNQYERGLLGTFGMFGLVAAQFIVNGFTLKLVHFFGDTKMSWTITFAIYAAVGLG